MTRSPEEKPVIAILFLIFNRPDTTKKVFEAIRQARPPRLYVAADGARPNRPGELDACHEARAITANIDWPCDVKYLFREQNLGCKGAISSAIDWFFEHEEEGIILEDDCLPDPTFFNFCQTMLERYRDEEKVMMITGSSVLPERYEMATDYFFTRYYFIWGWATWKRAWKHYDRKMSSWPSFRDAGGLIDHYPTWSFIQSQMGIYQDTYDGKIDTWDVQWFFTCALLDGLSIMPRTNLISNIGLVGSHSDGKVRGIHFMDLKPLSAGTLRGPEEIEPVSAVERGVVSSVMEKFGYNIWTDNLSARSIVNHFFFILYRINPHRWKYGRFKQH